MLADYWSILTLVYVLKGSFTKGWSYIEFISELGVLDIIISSS